MDGELRRWLRFAAAAGLYRFRPTSWQGPVLLIVSILDVLVYAGALYMVVALVFEFSGIDRFMTMLVGLVPLRWSIGCAVNASRVAHFVKVCEPVYDRPVLATVILAMGPATLVFLISVVLLVIGLSVLPGSSAWLGHMIGWGVFVVLVHLTWNVGLVLIIVSARLKHVFLSEGTIIFAFLLLFILSPITYQFGDIPATASWVLTSMNPASHLVAAYQNAFWFGQNVSLQVLPLSALFSVAAVFFLFRFLRANEAHGDEDLPRGHHRLTWNGRFWHYSELPPGTRDRRVFRPWGGELPWITGRSLLDLLGLARHRKMIPEKAFRVLGPDSEKLLDTSLPIYAERVRNRLGIVTALMDPTYPVVLDRLLDNEDSASVRRFCDYVASGSIGRGDLIVLSAREEIANTLLRFSSPSGDASLRR